MAPTVDTSEIKSDFKSFRDLKATAKDWVTNNKSLDDVLPDITLPNGDILTPTALYINGDDFPETASDLDKASSISIVYKDSAGDDMRIQVNHDDSAWVSTSRNGGVGRPTSIKDGVLKSFVTELETDRGLEKALNLAQLDGPLNAKLASDAATNSFQKPAGNVTAKG